MLTPSIHPGKALLGEVLARDWNLIETAHRMGTDTGTVNDLLMELEDVTPDLADKIAFATGTKAAYWLRVHARFNASEAVVELLTPIEGQANKGIESADPVVSHS